MSLIPVVAGSEAYLHNCTQMAMNYQIVDEKMKLLIAVESGGHSRAERGPLVGCVLGYLLQLEMDVAEERHPTSQRSILCYAKVARRIVIGEQQFVVLFSACRSHQKPVVA